MSEKTVTATSVMTEKELLTQVLAMAEMCGWMAYHQVDMGFKDESGNRHYSRRIGPGFPDLVLCHPVRGQLIFAELKTEKGKMTEKQCSWVGALFLAQATTKPGHTHQVYIWRPADLPEIEKILTGT